MAGEGSHEASVRADGPPGPGGTFAPFRYPAFRAIWIANLFSNLGATLQSVAAAWLMTDLTTSHQLIALVQSTVKDRFGVELHPEVRTIGEN